MDGDTKQKTGQDGGSGTTRQASIKSQESLDSAKPPEPLQLFPEENNPLKPRPYSAT